MASVLAMVQGSATLLAHYKEQPEERRMRMVAAEVAKLLRAIRSSQEVADNNLAIVETIVASDFPKEEQHILLAAVADASLTAASAPGATSVEDRSSFKRKGQDWQHALPHVLPKRCWDDLANEQTLSTFMHVAAMGLRNPSEPTSRSIALCMMYQTDGYTKVTSLTNSQRLGVVRAMKSMWEKSGVGKGPDPGTWIHQMPDSIEAIQKQFPTMWKAVFADAGETPMPSPISAVSWHHMSFITRCRDSPGLTNPSVRTICQFDQHSMSNPGGGLATNSAGSAMEMAMQQCMQAMVSSVTHALAPLQALAKQAAIGDNVPWQETQKGPSIQILGALQNQAPKAATGGGAASTQPDQLGGRLAEANGAADSEMLAQEKEGEATEDKGQEEGVTTTADRILGGMQSTKKKKAMKRPAAKPGSVKPPVGKGIVTKKATASASGPPSHAVLKNCVAVDSEFKGWTCWKTKAAGRNDKYYVRNKDGMLCRSKPEVRTAMGM